jgi:hypothetical protein
MNEEFKLCEKRRYETEQEALDMINHIIRIDWSPKLRAYKCPTCHNWHLTSKPQR